MSVNANWPRWIFASCSKHFADAIGNELEFFVEGQKRHFTGAKDRAEFRFDGPRIIEYSKNFFHVFVEINVLIHSVMDNTDFHHVHRSAGLVATAFTTIPLYRYGDGTEDDGLIFGCLYLLQSGRANSIEINHIGQVDPAVPAMQSSLEGHYTTYLEN